MNALERLRLIVEDKYSESKEYFPDDDSKREGYREALHDVLKALAQLMDTDAEIVRVIRIYEFSGPRHVIEKQLAMSVQGEREFGNGGTVRAATLGLFPEVLYPQKGGD